MDLKSVLSHELRSYLVAHNMLRRTIAHEEEQEDPERHLAIVGELRGRLECAIDLFSLSLATRVEQGMKGYDFGMAFVRTFFPDSTEPMCWYMHDGGDLLIERRQLIPLGESSLSAIQLHSIISQEHDGIVVHISKEAIRYAEHIANTLLWRELNRSLAL